MATDTHAWSSSCRILGVGDPVEGLEFTSIYILSSSEPVKVLQGPRIYAEGAQIQKSRSQRAGVLGFTPAVALTDNTGFRLDRRSDMQLRCFISILTPKIYSCISSQLTT